MSQYEPIVIKKKQLRTVAGTPASLVYNLIKATLIVLPVAGIMLFSDYIVGKKKLIAELDEYDLFNRKMNKLEEYKATKNTWSQPYLRDIAASVLEKFEEKGILTTTDENSPTRAEIRGDN